MTTAKEQGIVQNNKKHFESWADKGITSSSYVTIKWIAIISMLTHHISVILNNASAISYTNYVACFGIGRLAFPLFCFLLVESFYFTKNKIKHLIKLILLAIISEIPFDLFTEKEWFSLTNQNVIITLAIGFMMLLIMEYIVPKFLSFFLPKANPKGKMFVLFELIINAEICHLLVNLAVLCHSDYDWKGIILIALLWYARKLKHRRIGTVIAICAFILMNLYYSYIYLIVVFTIPIIFIALSENKCKGLIPLFFFEKKPFRIIASIFYPLHLFILGFINIFTAT